MNIKEPHIFVFCLAVMATFSLSTAVEGAAQDGPEAIAARSAPVTFEGLVYELADRHALARLPDPPYTIKIVKRSNAEAEPAGQDEHGEQAEQAEQGKQASAEWTVASFEGPGAIVRIWSPDPAGTLRIYLDDEPEPIIEAPASELLGGTWRVPPPFAASVGSTSVFTLPLPFATRCRITCDTGNTGGTDDIGDTGGMSDTGDTGPHYGVTARRYDESVSVRTFTLSDLDTFKDDLSAAANMLSGKAPVGPVAVYEAGLDITTASSIPIRPLDPDQEPTKFFPARQIYPVRFDLPEGGRAISAVTVKLFKYLKYEKRHEPLTQDELAHALRSVDIGFQFDRKVYSRAPLGDFMGIGTAISVLDDSFHSVQADGTMTSRWIMPYQTSGVVELHNLSQELDIWAELTIEVIPWDWDERSLYFVPHWTAGLETEPRERWSYVTLTAAQGRLVGQSLTVMNPVSAWWGGLKETLMLGDGETLVPLNAGDVFAINDDATSTFASPLLSRPRAPTEASDGHLGYTTLNRLMLLDAVPFDTGFNVSITANEHLEGLPDFGSLLYFYVTEDRSFPTGYAGYLDKVRSLTSPPVALDITNPIECESLAFQTFGQDVTTRVRELLPRAGGLWSAGADLFVHANSQGDGIELTIPAPNDQPASLTLYPSGGDAAGIVAISVNGRRVIDAIDLSARPPIALLRPITLGIHTPIDRHFTIRIEAIAMGENSGVPNSFRPDAMRYSFGLDCVTIVNPKRNVR